jgi:hypothetical protein
MNQPIVRIMFHVLPHRPQRLSDSAISNVFGGCLGRGERCNENKDCCRQERNGSTWAADCSQDANPMHSHKQCW